jgi:phytoene dehydrogenase-like protein
MKTFLRVTLLLLPLPVYQIAAGFGQPLAGALAGLALAVAIVLARHGARLPPPFEIGLIAGLSAAAAGLAAGLVVRPAAGEALVLAGLAAGAMASLWLGQPWTAAFSAADQGGAAATRLFFQINRLISGLWAALFAWLGLAAALALGPVLQWGPLALGVLASIVLPEMLMRRGLRQMLRGTGGAWAPPRFDRSGPAGAGCDVAVIGAGIGGLTAAALLADAGLRVEVFEQHDLPGGFAHTWVRRARLRSPETGEPLIFRFDSGVHDVSGWHRGGTVRNLFDRLGIAAADDWLRLDHRYVIDGLALEVPRDWQAWRDRLAREFPHEAEGIRAVFAELRTIYDAMFSTARHWGGFPGMPGTPEAVLAFAKANPLAVGWLDRPWSELLARHVRDPAVLRWLDALTGYITDAPARLLVRDMVPIYGYYFEGGYYPRGGSGRLADLLVGAIEARGGRVHLRQTVTRVLVEGGAAAGVVVRAATDPLGRAEREVRAPAVVCNADLIALAERLLAAAPGAVRALARQTGALEPTCSAVGVHLGLKGRLDLPPVIHLDGPEGSVALCMPSAVDPSAAPPGHSTLELLELLPAALARDWFPDKSDDKPAAQPPGWRALRRDPAYLARKKAAGDALVARARAVIPILTRASSIAPTQAPSPSSATRSAPAGRSTAAAPRTARCRSRPPCPASSWPGRLPTDPGSRPW